MEYIDNCDDLFELSKKERLKELQNLKEMATVCKKSDGFGIIIEVHSEDHGILGDKTNPAHAHIKTIDDEYLGKFAITLEPPRTTDYIFDCDKNIQIPIQYKKSIVEWANKKNKDEVSGWTTLKIVWRALHP